MQIATGRQKITIFLCAVVLALGLCALVPLFAHAESGAAPAKDAAIEKVEAPASSAKATAAKAQATTAKATTEKATTSQASTIKTMADPSDSDKAKPVDTSIKYGYDNTKPSSFVLTSATDTASFADFQSHATGAMSTTGASDAYVAEFDSFKSLIKGTKGWFDYLGKTNKTQLGVNVDNAEIALSHIADTFGGSHIYSDISFAFNNVTVYDEPGKAWSGNNDNGYFHLYAEGNISMTFEDCDLQQCVQRGITDWSGNPGNPVDMTFVRCDFNGEKVLTPAERNARAGRYPSDIIEGGLVDFWDPNHTITNSYFGTSIGNLIIEDCVNLRVINGNGTPGCTLSVTNSSFVMSRDAIDGEDLGGILACSNGFTNFVFKGNSLLFEEDGKLYEKPLYVSVFDKGWQAPATGDYFYARPDMGVSGVSFSSEEGSEMTTSVNKSDGVTRILYVAYTDNPEIPADVPEEDPSDDPTNDPADDPDEEDVPVTPNPGVPSEDPVDTPEVPSEDPVDTPEVPEDVPVTPNPSVPSEDPVPPIPNPGVPSEDPVDTPEVPAAPADPAGAVPIVPIPAAIPAAAPVVIPVAAPAPAAPAPADAIDADTTPLAETESIGDDSTPMGTDSSWALLNLLLTVLAVIESLALLITFFTRKREEEEEEEEDSPRKRTALRLASVLVAIVAVIVFILTEDMTNPMAFTDQWTLLMFAIALVQTVATVLSKKKYETQESAE